MNKASNYTQKNLLEPNGLPFGVSKSVWFQINRKRIYTIAFRFDFNTRILEDSSACIRFQINQKTVNTIAFWFNLNTRIPQDSPACIQERCSVAGPTFISQKRFFPCFFCPFFRGDTLRNVPGLGRNLNTRTFRCPRDWYLSA